MKEPNNTTAAVMVIKYVRVSLKARPDEDDMNPSGWSIIAFAPSASVRCVRAHQPKHLDLFIRGILALTGGNRQDGQLVQPELTEVIHQITGRVFE